MVLVAPKVLINNYLLVGVGCHHAVKGALQAGLKALRFANHRLHGGKLLVVSGQKVGHSDVQFAQLLLVFTYFGSEVGALGGQRRRSIQQSA